MKRLLDIMLSIVGLVLAGPLLLLCAAAVRLDSPGPVLFRQERVGRLGRIFRINKFRTMSIDAGRRGPLVSTAVDPRITRSGHWLRRYKLDELPQLLNVLTGEMSLVGPRPEVAQYVAAYPPAVRDKVLSVRPGITDLASIEYMDENVLLAASEDPETTYLEEILPRKLDIYLRYVERQSFWLDISILLKTFQKLIWR